MKKFIYLIVVIVALGLIVPGCLPVVPPIEQDESGTLPNKSDVNPGESIQDAINAASSGDTINVKAGTYTEQLLIQKPLTIIGAGESTTIIKAPTSRTGTVTQGGTWDYIVAAYHPTTGTINVRIEGFTIDADSLSKTGGTAGLIGVFFRDVSGTNAGLYSCTIQGFGTTVYESWGVRVYGDSDLTIDDNTLTDYTRDGIVVNGDGGVGANPDVVISNNDLTGSSIPLNGIQIAYGATGTIIGNTVRDHTRPSPAAVGIFTYESNGITINSNTVQNSHDGILLQYSSNCKVLENEVSDSGWGIVLNNADDNEVLENEISDSTTGISLSNSHDNDVLRNEIEDLTHEGIFLIAGSSGNKVEKNEISQVWWGIVLNDADDNEVLENEISDSLTGIMLCQLAEGNQVRENGITAEFEGIFILGANGNFIEENQVSDSGWGIVLNDADGNEVLENEISDSLTGIMLCQLAKGNQVRENGITADFEGIFILGANGNFIEENQVSDSGWGIVLNDANDNEVLENEIASSSEAGISAWLSSGNLIKENEVSGSGWLDLFDDSAPAPPLDNDWEDNEYDTKNW